MSKMTKHAPPGKRSYRKVIREVRRYVEECRRRKRPVSLGMIVAAAHDVSGYLDDLNFVETRHMAMAVLFDVADWAGLDVPDNVTEQTVDYLP